MHLSRGDPKLGCCVGYAPLATKPASPQHVGSEIRRSISLRNMVSARLTWAIRALAEVLQSVKCRR
tara:strand:- start:886 stop:1083 length:198 start_codon:yes stop_codon:yes gene_type:complete